MSTIRITLAGLVSMTCCLTAAPLLQADPPRTPEDKTRIMGQPTALIAQPESLAIHGPRGGRPLLITGRYPDGSLRDLTQLADWKVETPGVVALDEDRFVVPIKDGSTALVVQAGPLTVRVPVVVTGLAKPEPVSFKREFIAALNVGGCNSGACHGTPSGKNGFKLSLRGFDPAADFAQLTRDVLGRRTDRQGPEASLIYQKALGRVPHEGSTRFAAGSLPGQVMYSWLAEGLQDDVSLPALKKLEVLPGPRVLKDPQRWQQLAVLAHFGDGLVRDVTRLTVFTSSDNIVASVNSHGLVEFSQPGEVAILCRYLEELVPVRLTYLEKKEGFTWPNPPENNYVDKHIFSKLKLLSIQPSELCSDDEFLRRVFLDVCGILPTAAESKAFLQDKGKDKRARLIDQLLDRTEYADFWTLKWADILRSNRKTIEVKGTHVLQKWLNHEISQNTPVDAMVRDLLTAGGSSFSNPPANYYRIARDPTSLAETTAQLFFGIRMQCAKCHNHPFERWTQDDYYSMAAFFARVKTRKDPTQPVVEKGGKGVGGEFIYVERAGEVVQPRTNKTMPPRFMGGQVPEIPAGKDRREVLAQWLTAPENPFFAKSIANRLWFHVMGRGIVDPVDDFRESNPSANDDLLDALAKDFVAHKFDAKHVLRTILNSRTYQLSAQSNPSNKDDNKYFSKAVTKLLTAEQLFDALCQVTEVPEKFAGLPMGTRAVQLPDGEVNHPFLKTFGQPARELACECERESDSNLAQALQLINGPSVNDRLRNPKNLIGRLMDKKLTERQMLDEMYLATLSRAPAESEVKAALEHVQRSVEKRRAWEDVHWALINSKEFLFRH